MPVLSTAVLLTTIGSQLTTTWKDIHALEHEGYQNAALEKRYTSLLGQFYQLQAQSQASISVLAQQGLQTKATLLEHETRILQLEAEKVRQQAQIDVATVIALAAAATAAVTTAAMGIGGGVWTLNQIRKGLRQRREVRHQRKEDAGDK